MKIAETKVRKYLTSFCFLSCVLAPGVSSLHAGQAAIDKDNVKRNFHKVVDSVDEQLICEKVDQIAEALDKDKLKSAVDEFAKFVEYVSFIAENKDKIKEWIDQIDDVAYKEKIKEAVTQVVRYLDKDAIKSTFDQKVEDAAQAFAQARDYIKDGLRQYGSDLRSIQDYLNRYEWKKFIPDQASSEVATLSNLKLNGYRKAVIARPQEHIKCEVVCDLNREACSALKMYRVVLGIKHRGGQTSIGNHLGLRAGKELEQFVLVAPKEPGIYEIGFKTVHAAFESNALNDWNETNSASMPTIGLIIVQ